MRDLPDDATLKWELILADDPAEIAGLEAILEGTQAEAVDEMIEASCWSDDLPHLLGHRGTPQRRLEALRELYRLDNPPAHEFDPSRLSPVEYRLAEALQVTFPAVPTGEEAARAVIAWAQEAEQAKAAGERKDSIEEPLVAALNAVRRFVDDAEDRDLIDRAIADQGRR